MTPFCVALLKDAKQSTLHVLTFVHFIPVLTFVGFSEELVDGSDSEVEQELLEANLNSVKREAKQVEEVPAKEPKPNAQPSKSVLKKLKAASESATSTTTQEKSRQEQLHSK